MVKVIRFIFRIIMTAKELIKELCSCTDLNREVKVSVGWGKYKEISWVNQQDDKTIIIG